MSYEYASRKRTQAPVQKESAQVQPSIDAIRAGTAKPTAEQMGRRVDLPDAMRTKMEESFGADLSSLKLYESEAVGAAGAEAVTQGSHIAFAPGMLDFSSFGGQALLGHELSHVVSQARGEVTGGGFLNDRALEARADREGAMAAAGQQIAAPVAAMSSVGAAPSAGPMQAKKKKEEAAPVTPFEGVHIDPTQAGQVNTDRNLFSWFNDSKLADHSRAGSDALVDSFHQRYDSGDYEHGMNHDLEDPATGTKLSGLNASRLLLLLRGSLGEGKSADELTGMYDKLLAPQKKNQADPAQASADFGAGIDQLKGMYYDQLKKIEATYGKLGSQMHPEDFIRQIGPEFFDQTGLLQDAYQMMAAGPAHFNPKKNKKDAEFARLATYYNKVFSGLQIHAIASMTHDYNTAAEYHAKESPTLKDEKGIGGPSMDKKQLAAYQSGLEGRASQGGWAKALFGRFKKKR